MKKLLAIAVATALTAPAAMADTTLYGKLHGSVAQLKNGATGNKTTAVESHSSRFGIRGSNALDNDLSATFGIEYGLHMDGDNGGAGPSLNGLAANGGTATQTEALGLSSRNQFVGVKGGFGEVRLGKMDTPSKVVTASQDIFADTYADLGNMINVDNHRPNNTIAYINKFGPVGVSAAHSTGLAAQDDKNNTANSVMANFSQGPFYAGLGYTKVKNGNVLATGSSDANAATHTNLGLGFKNDTAAANVVLEQVESDTGPVKLDNAVINGSYKMDKFTVKGQYGESKRKGATGVNNGTEKATALGVDYSLGKRTHVYFLAAEDKNPTRVTNTDFKNTATAIGIVSDF